MSWDFASLKTYHLLAPPTNLAIDSLNRDRIVNAINSGLAARGYSEVDANADFSVAYHIGSENKIEVANWGYAYGQRGGYWGGSRTAVDVHQYREGTLIVDIVDTKTNKLIWRGIARKVLDVNPTPQHRTKTINAAVEKILENFPPTK